jgi:hypothetical protein
VDTRDVRDSYEIIRQNKGKTLETKDAWHECPAYQLLNSESQNTGIWIPQWVGRTLRNSRQARLLSWILWWFDDEGSRSNLAGRGDEKIVANREIGLCRARYFAGQRRWLCSSFRQLARETTMSPSTAHRNLFALKDLHLIDVAKYTSGPLLVSPMARPLAEAYYCDSGDEELRREFERGGNFWNKEMEWMSKDKWRQKSVHPARRCDGRPGWFETETRVRSMNRGSYSIDRWGRNIPVCRGTFVTDWVMVACERKPVPAWVLSQILWWFGLDQQGLTRARITRNGYLWIAKSHRQLSKELGIDHKLVRDHLDYLIDDRSFLARELWPFNRCHCRGKTTLHLRPLSERLSEVFLDIEDEVRDIEYFRTKDLKF